MNSYTKILRPVGLGFTRRRLGLTALATGAAWVGPSWASAPGATRGKNIKLIQIVDASVEQQDVTKDFVVGVRAAFSEVNQRGGLKGRTITHEVIETTATELSVDQALAQARADGQCAALMGTVGDGVARMVTERTDVNSAICQCAPWLMSEVNANLRTFNIFANRAEQLAHVVRVLSVMKQSDMSVVYAHQNDANTHAAELGRATQAIGLRTQSFIRAGDWKDVARRLNRESPPILLFVGGTPEFIGLMQAMGPQSRQRFMIGLADVNLQTVQQLRVPTGINVVATQVAPVVTSGLMVVRDYRNALVKYFDEPPTSQSLSGYISARVVLDLLKDFDPSDLRGSTIDALKKRSVVDLNGFTVSSRMQEARRSPFVTQSMLTADGRVLG